MRIVLQLEEIRTRLNERSRINPHEVAQIPELIDAGASHFIVMIGSPFDFSTLEQALTFRDQS